MKSIHKQFIREFHLKRCGNLHITNEQEYECLLYKTLVVNLTMFDGDNWGDFDFTDWIAAISLYEFENNLPSKYSELRDILESKHQGFYVEPVDLGDRHKYDQNKKNTILEIDPKYDRISSESDYYYHLHKSIEVMFQGSLKDKQHYHHTQWWQAVKYYEHKHRLTNRSSQFFQDERFRKMREVRNNL